MQYGYVNPYGGGMPTGAPMPPGTPIIPESNPTGGDAHRRAVLDAFGYEDSPLDSFYKARQDYTGAKAEFRTKLGDSMLGKAEPGALAEAGQQVISTGGGMGAAMKGAMKGAMKSL